MDKTAGGLADWPSVSGVAMENVCKRYDRPGGGSVAAVRGVTLNVPEGELLTVLGPSGSGKTTLLRLIAGLESVSSGTVSIGGKIVNAVPPEERDVAMVFQEHSLYPHLTVQENLGFGLKLRGCRKDECQKRVRAVADLLGLGALLDRSPNAISGGERQRVALGRALILKPKVLLLDEPFSSLDTPLRTELRREIRKLHQALGATTVYVTHDQLEAMSLGGRIAVLREGLLLQEGSPREVYQNPKDLFTAQFLGSPPMNLFSGVLTDVSGAIWFHESAQSDGAGLQFEPEYPERLRRHLGKPVLFGVRPEAIRPGLAELNVSGRPELIGCLDAVEFAGAETLIVMNRSGRRAVLAKGPGDFAAAAGSKLRLVINTQGAHFFDAADGRSLD